MLSYGSSVSSKGGIKRSCQEVRTEGTIFYFLPVMDLSHSTWACLCDYLQKDYHFEYTECDGSGSRWRVAIPNPAVDCSGLPDPVRGKECSMS